MSEFESLWDQLSKGKDKEKPKEEVKKEMSPPESPIPEGVDITNLAERIHLTFPNISMAEIEKLIEEEKTKAAGLLTNEACASIVVDRLKKTIEPPEPDISKIPVHTTEEPTRVEQKSVSVEDALKMMSPEIVEQIEQPQIEEDTGIVPPPFRRTSELFPVGPVVIPSMDSLDYTPAKTSAREVIALYSSKGEGKTMLAFTKGREQKETIDCLCFDEMAEPVRKEFFNGPEDTLQDGSPRIIVWDCVRYLDKTSPQALLVSSDLTFRYTNNIIENHVRTRNPDWIVVDGTEIYNRIAEMTMRCRNNILPFQGISNLNLWKERLMYIDQLHIACLKYAKKGVIYTFYPKRDEIIQDGEVVQVLDNPNWIGDLLYKALVVIKIEGIVGRSGTRFIATVKSSKIKNFRTGRKIDITDKGFSVLEEPVIPQIK